MIIQAPTKSYTKEEYLQLEENSDLRHEYIDGEMIEMTGGTTNHNTLSINFVFAFLSKFNNQNYFVESLIKYRFVVESRKNRNPTRRLETIN